MDCFATRTDAKTVRLMPVTKDALTSWIARSPKRHANWIAASGFDAGPGKTLLLPGDGKRGSNAADVALLGVVDHDDIWSWGSAAAGLPGGRYVLDEGLATETAERAALGWALGSYRFRRYRNTQAGERKQLVWPKRIDRKRVEAVARGAYLTRDLINTPASDMGPEELAGAARDLAREHKAKLKVTVGDALLKGNFPMVHAVGRASARPPRLIDMTWGKAKAPKVTLVGKGVCFDSGGLDLKPSQGMLLMKKDMGGAAQVLGLAAMIMASGLDLRLRVLIPAVENAVSGNAMRPLDVLTSRKGLTVEVGNTDAEGRLILADALALAGEEDPEMVLEFATLTGAARIALGTDLPALFCNDERLADAILAGGKAASDPLWRMPLHQPYRRMLDSKTADLSSIGSAPFGGAITAALFLQQFVPDGLPWAHVDLMAWNRTTQPGRPEGGEAQGIRAAFDMLRARYG